MKYHFIKIEAFQFYPAQLLIPIGSTVVWQNVDVDGSMYSIMCASKAPEFRQIDLHAGEKFAHTFHRPGDFGFYCCIYHFMQGMVRVVPTLEVDQPALHLETSVNSPSAKFTIEQLKLKNSLLQKAITELDEKNKRLESAKEEAMIAQHVEGELSIPAGMEPLLSVAHMCLESPLGTVTSGSELDSDDEPWSQGIFHAESFQLYPEQGSRTNYVQCLETQAKIWRDMERKKHHQQYLDAVYCPYPFVPGVKSGLDGIAKRQASLDDDWEAAEKKEQVDLKMSRLTQKMHSAASLSGASSPIPNKIENQTSETMSRITTAPESASNCKETSEGFHKESVLVNKGLASNHEPSPLRGSFPLTVLEEDKLSCGDISDSDSKDAELTQLLLLPKRAQPESLRGSFPLKGTGASLKTDNSCQHLEETCTHEELSELRSTAVVSDGPETFAEEIQHMCFCILISSCSFAPRKLQIPIGATVQFVLDSENTKRFEEHVILGKSETPELCFSTPILQLGGIEEYSITLNQLGQIKFACEVYPHMTGLLNVIEPGESAGRDSPERNLELVKKKTKKKKKKKSSSVCSNQPDERHKNAEIAITEEIKEFDSQGIQTSDAKSYAYCSMKDGADGKASTPADSTPPVYIAQPLTLHPFHLAEESPVAMWESAPQISSAQMQSAGGECSKGSDLCFQNATLVAVSDSCSCHKTQIQVEGLKNIDERHNHSKQHQKALSKQQKAQKSGVSRSNERRKNAETALTEEIQEFDLLAIQTSGTKRSCLMKTGTEGKAATPADSTPPVYIAQPLTPYPFNLAEESPVAMWESTPLIRIAQIQSKGDACLKGSASCFQNAALVAVSDSCTCHKTQIQVEGPENTDTSIELEKRKRKKKRGKRGGKISTKDPCREQDTGIPVFDEEVKEFENEDPDSAWYNVQRMEESGFSLESMDMIPYIPSAQPPLHSSCSHTEETPCAMWRSTPRASQTSRSNHQRVQQELSGSSLPNIHEDKKAEAHIDLKKRKHKKKKGKRSGKSNTQNLNMEQDTVIHSFNKEVKILEKEGAESEECAVLMPEELCVTTSMETVDVTPLVLSAQPPLHSSVIYTEESTCGMCQNPTPTPQTSQSKKILHIGQTQPIKTLPEVHEEIHKNDTKPAGIAKPADRNISWKAEGFTSLQKEINVVPLPKRTKTARNNRTKPEKPSAVGTIVHHNETKNISETNSPLQPSECSNPNSNQHMDQLIIFGDFCEDLVLETEYTNSDLSPSSPDTAKDTPQIPEQNVPTYPKEKSKADVHKPSLNIPLEPTPVQQSTHHRDAAQPPKSQTPQCTKKAKGGFRATEAEAYLQARMQMVLHEYTQKATHTSAGTGRRHSHAITYYH